MNEDWSKTFCHLAITPEQLVDALNIKGVATGIWLEEGGRFLHLVTQMDDPSVGFTVPPYGYVEISNLRKERVLVQDTQGFKWHEDKYSLGDIELFWRRADG